MAASIFEAYPANVQPVWIKCGPMNETGVRAFMRREDYAPRQTPSDSPFRKYVIKCLQCDCVKLKLTINYDEETGETSIVCDVARLTIPFRLSTRKSNY